tara:strand:+ start:1182 stop:1697 length:516 start_codon:yes stop_codon:yes gene_type:complete
MHIENHTKASKPVNKLIKNFVKLINSFKDYIIFNVFGESLFKMISEHIMMYHKAQQDVSNEQPDLKDSLPPPTPKQIIHNLNSFIDKQNECFGHASDKKNKAKKFEDLSIDELNEFHELLSNLNKSFFDDKDYSIEKVEQISFSEAASLQKELDTRGFIDIKDKKCEKDKE